MSIRTFNTTTDAVRAVIVTLRHDNPSWSYSQICQEIQPVCKISKQAVRKIIINYERYGTVASRRFGKKSRKRCLLDSQVDDIDKYCKSNPHSTPFDVKNALNLLCNVKTVYTYMRKLGWVSSQTRYCAFISESNKIKRLGYCLRVMSHDEQFQNVVFVDETIVERSVGGRYMLRKVGEPNRRVGKSKHDTKVCVWAGISMRGAPDVCVFTGNMTKESYRRILQQHLEPFATTFFPDGYRLYQDNDPKHRSEYMMDYFRENSINLLEAPPQSPDLNPIEYLWNQLKVFMQRRIRPSNKLELVQGILTFWQEFVTPSLCRRYIGHLGTVIPKVIEAKGSHSGY